MNDSESIWVRRFTDAVFSVNTYCILCGKRSIVIDPLLSPALIVFLNHHDVDFAILTHEHYDHIRDANEIKDRYGIPVFCGEKAADRITDPCVNLSRYAAFMLEVIPFGNHEAEPEEYVCSADGTLADGQRIAWLGHELLIKETPGHSVGSISILVDEKYLFSGDAVFKDYSTATRMPGGSTSVFKSMTEKWLESLSQDLIVYPGHTEPFLLAERYSKTHERGKPVDDIRHRKEKKT